MGGGVRPQLQIILPIYLFFAAVTVGLWVYLELTDPSSPVSYHSIVQSVLCAAFDVSLGHRLSSRLARLVRSAFPIGASGKLSKDRHSTAVCVLKQCLGLTITATGAYTACCVAAVRSCVDVAATVLRDPALQAQHMHWEEELLAFLYTGAIWCVAFADCCERATVYSTTLANATCVARLQARSSSASRQRFTF